MAATEQPKVSMSDHLPAAPSIASEISGFHPAQELAIDAPGQPQDSKNCARWQIDFDAIDPASAK
jgi:hypothetical protein